MPYELVVIGASLGGLEALQRVLNGLPADFPVPIAAVQHRGRDTDRLADHLGKGCQLPVADAEDKDPLSPGRVHLAPADYHLLVEKGLLSLSVDPPVRNARPSIDALFESAADVYGDRVIGVLLTGASDDGARGLAAIRRRGGFGLVEDPRSAHKGTMPAAGLTEAKPDLVLALDGISAALTDLCRLSKGAHP